MSRVDKFGRQRKRGTLPKYSHQLPGHAHLERILLAATLSLMVTSCSLKKMAVSEVAGIVEDGVQAYEWDDELELVERSLPANIKLLEAMLVSDPSNTRLMVLLSRLYGSYAYGFSDARYESYRPQGPSDHTKDELLARINTYYQRGIHFATQAIKFVKPVCEEELKSAETVATCFDRLSKDDVGAMFWLGFNMAAYINRNLGSLKALSQAYVIEKAMNRVVKLDEHYFHGGAHLLLIAFYGGRPKMAGGDFEKAEEHYQKLKQIAGDGYLLGDVMYARYLLVQKQDKAGFHTLLTKVVAARDDAADSRLYSQIARIRARTYLSQEEDLFE